MAAGRPVVATDVGGAREAVKKKTGYLVAPRDFKQMAERVTYLLQNPEQARAMGEKGRAFVANEFSGVRQLQRVENLYEKLLS